MSFEPTPRAALPQRQLSFAGIVGGALAVIIVVGGITLRVKHEHQLEAWTETQAIPSVNVVVPVKEAPGASLDLPGRLEAFDERAHLCACQRLPEIMACRYRQPGEGR